MTHDKVLGLLGLAARAGKLVSGEFSTESSIKAGKAKAVIVAGDASKNTVKLFKDKCSYYKVPIYIYSDKEKLGKSVGREYRSSIAVLDENFSQALGKLLNMEE